MKRVFADTFCRIALANPLDQWHPKAVRAGVALGRAMIVTTEEVLTEFLAHFSGQGHSMTNSPQVAVSDERTDPLAMVTGSLVRRHQRYS